MPIGEEGGEEGGRRGVWREGFVLTESRVDEGARVIFWHRLFSSLLRTKVERCSRVRCSRVEDGLGRMRKKSTRWRVRSSKCEGEEREGRGAERQTRVEAVGCG